MVIRRVDNKFLPERIVEYLNRDVSEKDYAESLGINAEADAASVIRNAVDVYRKNLDYPNEESVKQYRDSLQLFGEACYLIILLRDQEESQEENLAVNQEAYN